MSRRSATSPHVAWPSRYATCLLALLFLCFPIGNALGATLRAEVDAREISRQLLHSRLEIPVSPGKVALWYPKWIPGLHAQAVLFRTSLAKDTGRL